MDSGIYQMGKGFETNDAGRIREGFEITRDMTDRIKKLVMDILYYTKIRKMEWGRHSVHQFVRDTLDIVSPRAAKHGIKIDTELDADPADDFFEADESSLQQAMVNILENAIEACIDSPKDNSSSISFHTKVAPDNILFTIQDNGSGMDGDALKSIFKIFFSSKGNQGTGLGLYIANKVVGRHRGEIKVNSTVNQGTRFLINIPRTVPDTARNPRGVSYPE